MKRINNLPEDRFPIDACYSAKWIIPYLLHELHRFLLALNSGRWFRRWTLEDAFNAGFVGFEIDMNDEGDLETGLCGHKMRNLTVYSLLNRLQVLSLLTYRGRQNRLL